jgi:RHS repeat-associated protein
VKFPTGQVSATTYDHASRVLAITVKTAGGTTLTSRSYTYQTAVSGGADQALKATMTDQSGTTTYGYDGLNRLTSDVLGTSTSSWTYDNDGNRLTAAKTGVPTTFSAYNGADQLCWSSTTSGSACASPPTGATLYTHDAMGNQTADKVGTTTLANSFNVFNQLTSTIAGATTQTNTYSGAGNAERLSAGATSFMNGTLGVTSETTGGYSTTYIREPDGNLVAMRTAGASAYYTSDNQGSVIALTDAAQALVATYTYDAWGNITTSTLANTNPWRYATSYTDTTTGYLKLGARYYNPTTARFTQPDPAATCGGYTYANDNPTNYTDPSGRSATCDIAAGLATIGPYTEWAA